MIGCCQMTAPVNSDSVHPCGYLLGNLYADVAIALAAVEREPSAYGQDGLGPVTVAQTFGDVRILLHVDLVRRSEELSVDVGSWREVDPLAGDTLEELSVRLDAADELLERDEGEDVLSFFPCFLGDVDRGSSCGRGDLGATIKAFLYVKLDELANLHVDLERGHGVLLVSTDHLLMAHYIPKK